MNANIILIHDKYAELNELCLLILEYIILIVGFQEVNLDLLQSKLRDNINRTFKKHFGSVNLLFSTTSIKAQTP